MHPVSVEMNQKMSLTLSGTINAQAVQLLVNEIDIGFDYYKFTELTLKLDSPGGEYGATRVLMESIRSHKSASCAVHVQAAQVCASAAAVILATGHWGTRSAAVDTKLLFHWARASMHEGQALTREAAVSLAHTLATADQKMSERLVNHMCMGAGGVRELVDLITSRLDSMLEQWDFVALALDCDETPKPAKQHPWVKELQRQLKRWQGEADEGKQKMALIGLLKSRFEKDSIMDLREAYALCLIDVVKHVLPVQKEANSTRRILLKERSEPS